MREKNKDDLIVESGNSLSTIESFALASESLMGQATTDLFTQRKGLMRVTNYVEQVGTNLNRGGRVITEIQVKARFRRGVFIIIIVLLVLAIGIVLYVKLSSMS